MSVSFYFDEKRRVYSNFDCAESSQIPSQMLDVLHEDIFSVYRTSEVIQQQDISCLKTHLGP